jgi:Effector protein
MGFWPPWAYEQFVEAHAGSMEKVELLRRPSGELFDEGYPGIRVSYDTMPVWMEFSNLITLDVKDKRFARQNETHFRLVRQAYQADMERYRAEVKSRLNQIKARQTGLALLAEIRATTRRLRIEPFHGKVVNARLHSRVLGSVYGTAEGKRINYRNPEDRRVGKGGGADSLIQFTPGMWSGSIMLHAANAPDEVLFHELVHASREMRGVMDFVPVNSRWDDQEEYLAGILTNIYLSEKGQTIFSGGHDFSSVSSDEANRNPPVTLLENFKNSQPDFYRAVAHLPNPPRHNLVKQYNWRRDYYLQKQKGAFTF